LGAAQAFEDTGVGAYKEQASELKSSNAILTYALQVHSVEARHAARIRSTRLMNGYAKVKPWIIGDDNTKGTPLEPIYQREADHHQVLTNFESIVDKTLRLPQSSTLMSPCTKTRCWRLSNLSWLNPAGFSQGSISTK